MQFHLYNYNFRMGYITFDKQQLINLEYSLQKELLRSNRSGSYASTTIIGCNTRKYHGLLVSNNHRLIMNIMFFYQILM